MLCIILCHFSKYQQVDIVYIYALHYVIVYKIPLYFLL